MIVVAGGIKGGSGKTTIATHLAVLAAASGRDVLLVDADDQETATDFTVLRNERLSGAAGYTSIRLSGPAVRTEVQRLAAKHDLVVIDTGGRDTTSQRAAISVADVLVVPFLPRSFDVWTLDKVEALVEEMRVVNPGLVALAFLNRADPRGADNDEAAALLAESRALGLLAPQLVARKAFSNAAAQGLAVTELRPRDPRAEAEMLELAAAVEAAGARREQSA
jgi:chromosome partitioning protein